MPLTSTARQQENTLPKLAIKRLLSTLLSQHVTLKYIKENNQVERQSKKTPKRAHENVIAVMQVQAGGVANQRPPRACFYSQVSSGPQQKPSVS